MSVQLSPHGREQESSSEAIAAFEGIALFGDVMASTSREIIVLFVSALAILIIILFV